MTPETRTLLAAPLLVAAGVLDDTSENAVELAWDDPSVTINLGADHGAPARPEPPRPPPAVPPAVPPPPAD